MEKIYLPSKKSRVKYFAIAALCAFAFLAFYHCPIKLLTGVDCPGCGMTRAFMCIILGDPAAAYYYNPLAPALFVQLAVLLYFQSVAKKQIPQGVIITLATVNAALLFAVWLIKII